VLRVAVVLSAAVLLSGCFSDDESEPAAGADGASSSPCDLYLRERGVFVRFTGEKAQKNCSSWQADRSAGDEAWTRTLDGRAEERFERVCVVYRGGSVAGMYATPTIETHGRAKNICAGLISQGWDELNRPNMPAGSEAEPSGLAPVRCSEGRCFQTGEPVTRPMEGALCNGGAWTLVGLTRDQEAGLWRCLPDPRPSARVTCDSLTGNCRQAGRRVYPPKPGARCAQKGRKWRRVGGRGTRDFYECTGRGGG